MPWKGKVLLCWYKPLHIPPPSCLGTKTLDTYLVYQFPYNLQHNSGNNQYMHTSITAGKEPLVCNSVLWSKVNI